MTMHNANAGIATVIRYDLGMPLIVPAGCTGQCEDEPGLSCQFTLRNTKRFILARLR
jgi:hypothetical protein